jgi:dTDP-glucose 4,6-dehydratase
MRVAILGGGNPYAINLVWKLYEAGIEHFGIGRSEPKPEPFWIVPKGYDYYQLHLIQDFWEVVELLDERKPDVIINFAAQGEGAASFGWNARRFYETNSVVLVRLAETLAIRNYLKQFVQISSSEVYGSVVGPASEGFPLRPSSPYAISKAAFDMHLESMYRTGWFPYTIVRPSNCYCVGQQLHRVIPKAIRAALTGTKMRLEGGGSSIKSYLYADDLSSAIIGLIKTSASGVYNVGPDESVTIRELVELVANVCGKELEDIAVTAPPRLGEDFRYELNSQKIQKHLDWKPTIELRDGIASMVEWHEAFPELLQMDNSFVLRR